MAQWWKQIGEALRMEEIGTGWPAEIIPYRAGVIGGLAGGIAMVGVALGYGLYSGQGIWLPVNLIGATLVRELQGAPMEVLTRFHPTALFAGLILHGLLSSGLGALYAMILPTLPGPPLLWAVIVGPLLWLSATFVILPIFNPVMARYVDWPSFALAHLIYGLIMGIWVGRTPRVRAER
ncbi:hypothetical protein [Thermoflexus sp.]|uniref:hypothetical protein n=1 Tax=Thermoflexus sp. TaxID=1969742 RepID=UPI0035E45DFC